MTRLLPSNASRLEVLAAQALAQIERVPVPIRDLLNPDRCPVALLPYLALLDAVSRTVFLDALGPRLLEAYPSSSAGITLFPFRRFFILAQR